MVKIDWDSERKKTEKEALKEHARLSKLYNEDSLSFELERKRMIDKVINGAKDEAQKERLRNLQEAWDENMKNAGEGGKRLFHAQNVFWKSVEDIWNSPVYQQQLIKTIKSGPENRK